MQPCKITYIAPCITTENYPWHYLNKQTNKKLPQDIKQHVICILVFVKLNTQMYVFIKTF